MPLSKLAAALGFATAAGIAAAEQLPLRIYTAADGLPSDRVSVVRFDSQGFLWLGTEDGLSRFDGYDFRNFDASDGIAPAPIRSFLETRSGIYWVGTSHGLVRFDALRESRAGRSNARLDHLPGGGMHDGVLALLEDRAGAIWIGTEDGLFRLADEGEPARFEPVPFATSASNIPVNALLEDPDGTLWVGSELGLFRRAPGGAFARVADGRGRPVSVQCLRRDRGGVLWMGTRLEGLLGLREAGHGVVPSWTSYTVETGLAGQHVTAVVETSDGTLWASCYGGLSEIPPDRSSIRRYTLAEGLSSVGVSSLAEDRDGDLWIGSDSAGLMRFARNGFRAFDERDGLKTRRVASLFESRDGAVCAFTRGQNTEDIVHGDGFLACFDGRRFETKSLRVPPGTLYGWGWSQFALQDENDEWWVPAVPGVFRFPGVPFSRLGDTPPRRLYGPRDGLEGNAILRLYEDRRGDLWMAVSGDRGNLARWDRRADAIRMYGKADGLPDREPMAFVEDRNGGLWIGLRGGGLVRYADERFALADAGTGIPEGSIRALALGGDGSVWLASARGGIGRIEDAGRWPPRFAVYGVSEGLSSANASSITLDAGGRVYVGTERGLERLDPATGNVQRFTAEDGLPRGVIETSLRDRRGDLWFGSVEGLSRLEPRIEPRRAPPSARIARVFVNGVRQPLPENGASTVPLAPARPGPTSLQVDYVAVDFAPGGRPRYQYRVDGLDADWSPPTDQRSVVYARLPAGAFRFRVRAVGNDGSIGDSAASVSLRVAPPLWRRPEVAAAGALLAAAAAYALHRLRLARALELERVRSRVARDLHDDVGAGLSEIAILSEVARAQGGSRELPVLSEIGDRARDLVDAMTDIVWSTDPRKDDVASLVQRIRRFAANALESRGIVWTLEVPEDFEARRLDPERRRQIFLVVKEALANVARHSRCARAAVRILSAPDELAVEVEDDGVGLRGAAGADTGHGLANMRARAAAVGGELRLGAGERSGTIVRLRVPLPRGRV